MPSVGRKRYLLGRLGAWLRDTGGQVFGADLTDQAPALRLVDREVRLPLFDDPGYWPAVDRLVDAERIDAVLPVRDAELAGWARRAESGQLAARVWLSPAVTLELCRDKAALYRAAASAGLRCPSWMRVDAGGPGAAAVDLAMVELPLIAKPVHGSGSRGVRVLRTPAQLRAWHRRQAGPALLQRCVSGPEYSIDAYVAADGLLRACCPRRRVQVRHGESVAGEPVTDRRLVELAETLTGAMRFRGVINIQVIVDAEGPWLIDLNPRMPGGIAITEAAGYPFIAWTLADLAGGR